MLCPCLLPGRFGRPIHNRGIDPFLLQLYANIAASAALPRLNLVEKKFFTDF